jgi:hypothetical protein
LLLPEGLENSKVTNILSDMVLNFKICDLLSIKEVSRISDSKDEIITLLSQIDFIKLSDSKESGAYEIDPSIVIFSLLNVPQNMTRQDLTTLIGIEEKHYLRMYKKSLFWLIIVSQPKDSELIMSKLKNCKSQVFSDESLKYDTLNYSGLMKSIQKILLNRDYQREASELKAEKKNSNKNNMTTNYNSNSSNKERTNSEAFSWRKKSTDGVNQNNVGQSENPSSTTRVPNSPKMSEEYIYNYILAFSNKEGHFTEPRKMILKEKGLIQKGTTTIKTTKITTRILVWHSTTIPLRIISTTLLTQLPP